MKPRWTALPAIAAYAIALAGLTLVAPGEALAPKGSAERPVEHGRLGSIPQTRSNRFSAKVCSTAAVNSLRKCGLGSVGSSMLLTDCSA